MEFLPLLGGIAESINVILGAEVIKKWAYLSPDHYSLTRKLEKRDKIWKEPDSLNHLIEVHLLEIYIALFREWERNSIGVYLLKQSSLPYYPIPGPTETFTVSSHIISQFTYFSDESEAPGSR